MPIVDREALSRMTMDELGNIRRGYGIKEHPDAPEPPPWRPSDLQRFQRPLTCHACDQSWTMPLYVKAATQVWCPHCGLELETTSEDEMG
jgi:hypothetical protein